MSPKYSDGVFRQRYNKFEYRFMHEGKQRSVYGSSKEICFNERTKFIINFKNESNEKAYTYGEWLLEWHRLYDNKIKAQNNIDLNKSYIDRICKALGHLELIKLSGIDIQNYLMTLEETKNTQHKIILKIKSSLRIAHALGKIRINPMIAVAIDSHRPNQKRALTFEEQQLIYEKISDKYKPLYFFCCCTGLRISEVLELKREHIDFNSNIIYAPRKKKKGKKNIFPIDFLPELFNFYKNTDFIFENYTYNGFKKYLQDLFKSLNIKGISIHSFRHTFASNCYASKIQDKQIQLWLGHETLAMTTDTYTHLIKSGTSVLFEYIKKLKDLL